MSVLSFCCLLVLKDFLHEECLVGGRSLAAAEKIEESVTVFEKDWRKPLCCFGDLHASGMCCITFAGAVIEKHCGEGTSAGRLPQESFEAEIAAGDVNDLRRDCLG